MNELFSAEQREQMERMSGVAFLFAYVVTFLLAAYWLHNWIRL
jgi:hypothetical protein